MAPHFSRELLALPDELKTKRLTLRKLRWEDEPLMWAINSDPEVMRYIMPPSTDREAHKKEFAGDLQEGTRYKFFYAICFHGQPAEGWIFVRPTEVGDTIEMGYRLQRSAWGQGLVPEAARAAIAMVQKHWQANSIMALILSDNKNSRRVLEKLGFGFEALTDQYYGETHELWVYRSRPELLAE